jgi:hypothetical protein
VSTLYGKGDRVRIRTITSEMAALVVEDEGEPVTVSVSAWRGPEPSVLVRPIWHVGREYEELGEPRRVPRAYVLGRYEGRS